MHFIKALNEFLFPQSCICCGKRGVSLCKECFLTQCKVNFVQKCHVCSKEVRLGFVHAECKESTYLDGLIYITNYNDLIKDLIKRGKYRGEWDVFNNIGNIASDYFESFYGYRNAVFTSVPMHNSKKTKKGFNQAEILAKTLSKRLNLEYKELLSRSVKTKTQVGMSKEEREVNLMNVFSVKSKDNLANLPRIVLVDDVYTTGTTLNQCAKVLKESGAREVVGFCFAKSRVW